MNPRVVTANLYVKLISVWREKTTMFFTIAFPIILILVFGTIFMSQDSVEFHLCVQDLDQTKTSADSVKALEVEGVMPSAETVLNKTYPLARPLFMFTNNEPAADSLIAKFIGLSLTENGKEIIEEIGFVPVPAKK